MSGENVRGTSPAGEQPEVDRQACTVQANGLCCV